METRIKRSVEGLRAHRIRAAYMCVSCFSQRDSQLCASFFHYTVCTEPRLYSGIIESELTSTC